MRCGIFKVLLVVVALSGICGQVYAAQSVLAVGRAEIVGTNKAGARSNALANAFREAVEKGIGVWVQGQTEVKDAMLVRDQILTRAQGYVTEHEIEKESVEGNIFTVTIRAQVAVDRIGADIKSLVGRVSTAMGNPSISFVLTTWEKRGQQGAATSHRATKISGKADTTASYDVADDSTADQAGRSSRTVNERSAYQGDLSTRERGAASSSATRTRNSASSVAGRAAAEGEVLADEGPNGAYLAGRSAYASDRRESSEESGSMSAAGESAYDRSVRKDSYGSQARDVQSSASRSSRTRSRGHNDASVTLDANTVVDRNSSYSRIDEDLWKKYPDMTIIDAFQQEFLAKNFDLMAADKARQIALTESLAQTSVNPGDRGSVREFATREGANFVARGELKVLGYGISPATGNEEVKSQVSVEIIDVNSGDVVGSFTNTATATSPSREEARMQSIKKNAVLAARTLAGQTIDVWQKRSLNGRQFSIEVRNIKSIRGQQNPIISAIKGVAQITAQTNPDRGTLLVKVNYKGDKEGLGSAIIDAVGSKPGFSESEFDGPANEDGKIVFVFKK